MLFTAVSLVLLNTSSVPVIPEPDVATGQKGVVASDEPLASEIGAQILRKGGNAVDAAVAVGLAMAVVQPTAGNLGGGGFMLVRMADGRSVFLDYRERAPRGASRNMYLRPDGTHDPDLSQNGLRAGGVPGTVAGLHLASQRYGKLPWKTLVQPALELARNGFPISASQATALERQKARLSRFPETQRVYLRGGNLYKPGETVRLLDLADVLQRLRDRGPDDFYRGETARRIDRDMRQRGGFIRLADLADYRVETRTPLTGTYRGHTLLTAPPPSSGGIALLQTLNQLEAYPLDRMAVDAPERIHRVAEAMRRAFADRSEFLGDPGYVDVPTAHLIDKSYARKLRLSTSSLATPSASVKPGKHLPYESDQTTHYSVVDAEGNCVANTYTLNGSFGSGDTVVGTGILMNNEMDDFAARPGFANMYGLIQGERNAIQPGRRPLSSMTPTIVLKDGKPILVAGSPGGPTIINTVIQVILNSVDHRMTLPEAVKQGRIHHQWLPDTLNHEPGALGLATEDLKKKGHRLSPVASQGIANCIALDPTSGIRTAVADRRYSDAKAIAE